MLRYRRYRSFVVFTIFVIFGVFWYFQSDGEWQPSSIGKPTLNRLGLFPITKDDSPGTMEKPIKDGSGKKVDLGGERKPESISTKEGKESEAEVEGDEEAEMPRKHDSLKDKSKDKEDTKPITTPKTAGNGAISDKDKNKVPSKDMGSADEEVLKEDKLTKPVDTSDKPVVVGKPLYEQGYDSGGRQDVDGPTPSTQLVHWTKMPEHFPISSTIPLPSGTPKAVPRIQAKFDKETEEEKRERLQKLTAIQDAAKLSWKGYKTFAYGHDEIRPVTGGKKDPFCGWAANLVDSLDTLYLMGFQDEFEEALDHLKTIDFTTSPRNDIPLFETTIRYLGGMLGAYDISQQKHKVLLDKSVELADILMGAFDTPNRMPITFYHWKPEHMKVPQRAGGSVVLAELGSLSLEFTRLAQVTKEPKYYDAIDRITDAFVEWQGREVNGTWLPGMFPTHVDASGCSAVSTSPGPGLVLAPQEPIQPDANKQGTPKGEARMDMGETGLSEPPKNGYSSKSNRPAKPNTEESQDASSGPIHKGEPGRGKIAGWDKPITEGGLDSKEAKEKLLEGKASELGEARKKSEPTEDAVDANLPKKEPAEADVLETKDKKSSKAKDPDMLDMGSTKRKRQLEGSLSDSAKAELDSETKSRDDVQTIKVTRPKPGSGTVPNPGGGAGMHGIEGFSHGRTPPLPTTTELPPCEAQNLTSSTRYGIDLFSLGGMSDSTYEYFPKQYLLLGGLEDKYRKLYEKSIDVATEKLLFRPKTPKTEDILFAGDWRAWKEATSDVVNGTMDATSGHLACFVGGMYAMGAKIFDRPDDLKLAAKLTDGCVWAYSITNTGIMPEQFELMACESTKSCEWNKTEYYEKLDPYRESREMLAQQAAIPGPMVSNDNLDIPSSYDTPSAEEKVKEPSGSADKVYGNKKKVNEDDATTSTKSATKADKADDVDKLASEDDVKGDKKAAGKALDKTLSKTDAKNPVAIHDDVDDKPVQRNPQKISDSIETRRLHRRQLDDIEETYDTLHSEDDDTDDASDDGDVRPGEPVKYAASPPSKESKKENTSKDSTSKDSTSKDSTSKDSTEKDSTPKDRTAKKTSSSDTEPKSNKAQDSDIKSSKQQDSDVLVGDAPTQAAGAPAASLPNATPLPSYSPPPAPTHEEYVESRIEDERLPPGFLRITGRAYILRPEAIESVWYMYRITGDRHWRKVGWDMFKAINQYTRAPYGNSAIDDVTKKHPELVDSQESFWMAETLKYFYLLFADEDVVSLDEWVLNTEAHPFRRPLPAKK